MNCFKNLDALFPCGAERSSGEVVSVSVRICGSAFRDESYELVWDYGVISWKRKAWYVNASVNAWHLHRNLCRELREQLAHEQILVNRANVKQLYTSLRTMVQFAYQQNAASGHQYFGFALDIETGDWVLDGEINLSI